MIKEFIAQVINEVQETADKKKRQLEITILDLDICVDTFKAWDGIVELTVSGKPVYGEREELTFRTREFDTNEGRYDATNFVGKSIYSLLMRRRDTYEKEMATVGDARRELMSMIDEDN